MERYLFLRMNYCRYRASQLQRRATQRALRQAASLLQEATGIRNHLVESNQRLVVSIAAGFANATTPLEDLVAAAQLPLLRAVDLFDVSRGYCFSTYATHTVRNHCRRELSKKATRDRRMSIGLPENLEPCTTRDPVEELDSTEQSLVRRFFAELVDREKIVVSARFGLGIYDRPHTFQEIGNVLGLSKERARVLTHRAIEKLKQLAVQNKLKWLEC